MGRASTRRRAAAPPRATVRSGTRMTPGNASQQAHRGIELLGGEAGERDRAGRGELWGWRGLGLGGLGRPRLPCGRLGVDHLDGRGSARAFHGPHIEQIGAPALGLAHEHARGLEGAVRLPVHGARDGLGAQALLQSAPARPP